jgi:hypothetical protein
MTTIVLYLGRCTKRALARRLLGVPPMVLTLRGLL